jgi:uncharacterized protein YgbK (DUF1537 family)
MGRVPTFAILADDLAGACDAGVQFVRADYSTIVHFDQDLTFRPDEADTVVLDTETRLLPEKVAYQQVFKAGLPFRQAEVIVKKIDSALRGPIAAEVAAALQATQRKIAVIAPAFPQLGRTTLQGKQLIHGIPVDQSEFAHDPLTPALQSHIPTLLSAAGIGPGKCISVKDLNQSNLEQILTNDFRWIVADAETNEHLDLLVSSIPDHSNLLWVGSAGLARSIANFFAEEGGQKRQIPFDKNLRILAVIGSMSEVAHKQIAYAVRQSGILPVEIPLNEVVGDHDPVLTMKVLNMVRGCFTTGESALIYISSKSRGEQVLPPSLRSSRPHMLTGLLAEITARLADEGLFDVVILSGGYTAVHVARRLGAWGIELLGELEAGIPVGKLLGCSPFLAITKAGSFGEQASLYNCIEAFR